MAFGKKNNNNTRTHSTIASEISLQQKAKKRNLKIIVASMILAVLVFIALNVIQSNILNREETVRVLVASKELSDGIKITEDNFSEYISIQERVIKTLPDNYIKEADKDMLKDKFIDRVYLKNEIISTDFISDSNNIIASIENPIETSLTVSGLSNAVGGILREGDIINIYSLTNTRDKGMVSNEIMLKAYITKAFDGSGAEIRTEDQEPPTKMFNLIISEDVEVEFNKALFSGTLRISKILY